MKERTTASSKTGNRKAARNGFSISRLLKIAKKKPLVIITPILGIIIIVLIILLITSNTAGRAAAIPENPDAAVAEEAAFEGYSYDESKWYMHMQTGFMEYMDDAYTCTTGIDVSEWSLDIDWDKIKASGIDFVICRVGYRGYGTGKFQFDQKLSEYLQGAQDAGLKTGVYFVTQAVNEEEAIEEAEEVLKKIEGFNITMPIYIDCEANTGEETRTDNLTKEQFTKNAIAFCKRIEEAGYRGGVYSNNTWIDKALDMTQLTDYDIWFAKYTNTPETEIPFDMWQYSASGVLDGMETNADLNIRLEKK